MQVVAVSANLTKQLTVLNQKTSKLAGAKYQKGERSSLFRLLASPLRAFAKSYLWQRHLWQGTSGMARSLLAAYEAFLVEGKIWELEKKSWQVYLQLKDNWDSKT